jgi:ABC-type uncharacterized transport system substrate-binding protein
MHTILAVAVGPQKDLLVDADFVAKGRLAEIRPYIEGLIEGLKKRGRRLGADFVIEYKEREPQALDREKGMAAMMAARGKAEPNLVFAMSTTALLAAKGVKDSVPVVFPSISDYKKDGLTKGKSATGISARRSQTAGECFDRFLATVPTLKEVRVLYKDGYGPADRALKLVQAAAKKRNVKVKPVSVKSHLDIEKNLKAMPKRDLNKPADLGVFVLPIDFCLGAARMIVDLAQGQKNLPTFFPITDPVRKNPGALGGYGVPQRTCGELASEHVDQILWGGGGTPKVKDAGDEAFEWAISSAAAKALNIKIPSVI